MTTIGTTSFFPTKPLGCYGDGGACFTNDDKIAEKLKALRNHGASIKFQNKYEEACPACGERWKVVKFNMKTWKDCVKCNKTQ